MFALQKVPKFSVTPVAGIIPADTTGYRLRATNVGDVIKELREKNAYVPNLITTTLNGTTTLTNTSLFQNVVTGTATGHSIKLPDATTMFTGERFEVINGSTASIDVKDSASTILFTLIPSSIATIYLAANFSAAGLWQASIANGAASGIQSYVVASDVNFTTTSSTDVDITSFSVVPVSGRYLAIYSADIEISTNNKIAECVFHGETVSENTRRTIQGVGSNFSSTQSTIGELTMMGTNTVHVKVNVDGGSLIIGQRSLVLIRLGA
jgi:hypothetical protein